MFKCVIVDEVEIRDAQNNLLDYIGEVNASEQACGNGVATDQNDFQDDKI